MVKIPKATKEGREKKIIQILEQKKKGSVIKVKDVVREIDYLKLNIQHLKEK